MENIIYVDTEDLEPPKLEDSIIGGRISAANALQKKEDALVTILVQAYNRFEKTKKCVESILENTKGINYELLLIDNGSTDDTFDYFKNLEYPLKTIIRVTKNVGTSFPNNILSMDMIGKYLAILPNDVVVTPKWLENILKCMESDPYIGAVNAMSSNVSNLQEKNIEYHSNEEMMEKALKFNVSDPRKWEERIRIVTLGPVYRKEAILAKGFPLVDAGFFHDFMDDDISFQIRRLGYKLIVAGDTWICHNHDFRSGEDKSPEAYQKSLKIGRENFIEKYKGIDSWKDIDHSFYCMMDKLPVVSIENSGFILGIDTGCGQPILDIKNYLRKKGVFDSHCSAFTQEAKYFIDLQTICDGEVICERTDVLRDYFVQDSFDYIVIGQAVNQYSEPWQLLNQVYSLLKEGGFIILKLKNAFSYREYVNMVGNRQDTGEYVYNIPLETIVADLNLRGNVVYQQGVNNNLSQEELDYMKKIWNFSVRTNEDSKVTFSRLMASEYYIIAQKGRMQR